jgi:23S rRNA (uridine2552-2'-O)-methyltransferase
MARSKSSATWLKEHVKDPFVRKAKADGFRSRASFKLLELVGRDKLLRPGMTVVDLGAAPGGWSQVAMQGVAPNGLVIALDLLPMLPIKGVSFVQADFRQNSGLRALEAALDGRIVDLVLSDMAPNMSGIAVTDQARAAELAELALEFASQRLKPGGDLLVKVFNSVDTELLRKRLQRQFTSVATRKPEASRDRSAEFYLLARGHRDSTAEGKSD